MARNSRSQGLVGNTMEKYVETESDQKIKACIDQAKSFAVIAGAGSGKTTSLVEALKYIRKNHENALRTQGLNVVCITFTNRAVEVIKKRLNSDELFKVSTLHSFLWREIKGFQSDIKKAVRECLIPARIAKKQEDDNGGNSQKAIAARGKVAELEKDLVQIESVDAFVYDETSGRNYSSGNLDHDDIVDLAPIMLGKLPLLRKIIEQKYPYIFVDEAQDTFPQVVAALNHVTEGEGLPIVGYFGDPMQQIYDKGTSDFHGPPGSEVILKEENYRCSTEVINFLNAFRKDIKQAPSSDNEAGSVELLLIQSEDGEEKQHNRKVYSERQLDKVTTQFDNAISHIGWDDDEEVIRLFLARQMIARRLGFPHLNKLFKGEYSSLNSQNDYESGEHYLLKPFISVLYPAIHAYRVKNNPEVLKVLRKYSPVLDPKGANRHKSVKDVVLTVEKSISALSGMWDKATVCELLKFSLQEGLIVRSERLHEALNDLLPQLEEYNEEVHVKKKGAWLAHDFFTHNTSELAPYIKFVNEETPFSTQHGVKGEEYKKVLVVFDDTEANWSLYSFSRMLAPQAAGKGPSEGQLRRSKKLAYVCFSRAEQDLKIILFTLNPSTAMQELINLKLFREDQISILE